MEEKQSAGATLTSISNAMVALHREHFGRGPGAAKTYIVDDFVICVMTDIYTQVEKTLIKAGKLEHVRETRQLHQDVLEKEFMAPIEELTGRKVDAFFSMVHVDPDVAVEMFLLVSRGGGSDGDRPAVDGDRPAAD